MLIPAQNMVYHSSVKELSKAAASAVRRPNFDHGPKFVCAHNCEGWDRADVILILFFFKFTLYRALYRFILLMRLSLSTPFGMSMRRLLFSKLSAFFPRRQRLTNLHQLFFQPACGIPWRRKKPDYSSSWKDCELNVLI